MLQRTVGSAPVRTPPRSQPGRDGSTPTADPAWHNSLWGSGSKQRALTCGCPADHSVCHPAGLLVSADGRGNSPLTGRSSRQPLNQAHLLLDAPGKQVDELPMHPVDKRQHQQDNLESGSVRNGRKCNSAQGQVLHSETSTEAFCYKLGPDGLEAAEEKDLFFFTWEITG